MRSLPYRVFSVDMSRMSSRTSGLTGGLPSRALDLQLQYRRQPFRCHPTTVSG
jgi:hypothetical protein